MSDIDEPPTEHEPSSERTMIRVFVPFGSFKGSLEKLKEELKAWHEKYPDTIVVVNVNEKKK